MIYLGIDIAKNTHVAEAMTSECEVLLQPFFVNSSSEFSTLKHKLDTLPNAPLLMGLESTAHYGQNLIYFLCQGYHVTRSFFF